ncbi:hypothetical protein KKG71_05955 [Patescibacteria group bacterium]|nr:hypothetical protein [Patescibacteria group bacterium]
MQSKKETSGDVGVRRNDFSKISGSGDLILSKPLVIAEIDRENCVLKTQDDQKFKVPVSVLPDRADIRQNVALSIKKSNIGDKLLNERHRRLEEMIN